MPSRAGRRRIAVACFAVLSAARAARADGDWVQVVEQSDAGVTLLLSAPEPVADGGVLRVPQFAVTGEPGLPVVYENGTWIAVPGPRGARLELLAADSRDLGRIAPELLPAPTAWSERHAAEEAGRRVEEFRAVPARSFEALYPDAVVALGGTARLRGRDVVALQFRPLQYQPDGTARFTRAARVRVVFADRPAPREPAPVDPVHEVLPNAATAARWAMPAAPAARPERPAGTELPAERLRIRIPQRGLYELSYADLRSANVPVDAIDPRKFRLFVDRWKPVPLFADSTPASWQQEDALDQAAIWVDSQQEMTFALGDRIVFYALGPEGWEDLAGTSTDSLAWFTHPYDRSRYAWLVWDGEFGRRVPEVAAAPQPGDSIVTAAWSRVHLEEDRDFDGCDDLWSMVDVRADRAANITVPLDLGGMTTATGSLRIKLGYGVALFPPSNNHVVDVRWDNASLDHIEFFQTGGAARAYQYPMVTLTSQSTLRLTSPPCPDPPPCPPACPRPPCPYAPATQFFEADIAWVRPLVAGTTTQTLEWSVRPTRAGDTYEIRGFQALEPYVWDVTDPISPQRLTGALAQPGGAWRVRGVRTPGQRAHYLAAAGTIARPAVTLRTIAPLRARTSAPDMVVVTHSTLRNPAERLAQYRRANWPGGGTPDIVVVDVADIYDNFSAGRLDPLAIRNYLKFLYVLDPARLRYVLFFGDATHDPRQLSSSSAPTLVPTLQPGVFGQVRDNQAALTAVDDWLAEMDTPRFGGMHASPVPDLAHGRITARNAAEADRIVDKVIAYETESGFSAWRNRIVLAGDDECHPLNGCHESYHIQQTEQLARLVPTDLDVVKFYLTEYPAVLGHKPQARAAFIRTWSEGCAVINYQGHGAPRQLADEVMFLSVDVPSLTNGVKAPLFLPLSCTVSEFDGTDRQSMCEDLLASTAGGAIATIGATKPTFVTSNQQYNVALFGELFRDGSRSRIPFGLAQQRTKVRATSGVNETYLLLGDPASSLLLPAARVRFTSGVETLAGGQRTRVEAEIVTADSLATPLTNFNGQAEVEVFGTADESGYRSATDPTFFIRYDLQGPPLYRGTVPVVNGQLAFQFIVPVGARVGTKGRVSAYAFGATMDAKGADPTVAIVLSDSISEPSTAKPRITLRFPDERTHVKAGTLLTAEIRDENGINIQGTTLQNSIYLDFDARNEPLNVTAQFRYAAGSDSVGSLSVPLPADLEAGRHSATLIASDNLLNTASETLEFEVVDPAVVQLVNVIAFPNPFRDWTRFFFEVTDPAEVEVRVFTTSGREVWRQQQRVEVGSQGSIKWDGVDLQEDTVANGTYLYRLQARPDRAGAPTLEHIGKIVVMR